MNPTRESCKSEPCVFDEGDYRYGFGCHVSLLVHPAILGRTYSKEMRSPPFPQHRRDVGWLTNIFPGAPVLFNKHVKYGLGAFQGTGTTRTCIPKHWENHFEVKHPGEESRASPRQVLLMVKKRKDWHTSVFPSGVEPQISPQAFTCPGPAGCSSGLSTA